MAKPAMLQNLEKGKLLTGQAFPGFVETWNYTINRLENLKGDRDTNPRDGHILVDNSDPEHPVVRFVKDKEKEDAGLLSAVESIQAVGGDKLTKNVSVSCVSESGLAVQTSLTDNLGNGTLVIDIADRGAEEEYGCREISVGGASVAKVLGTTDFEIAQKRILAGDGIAVMETDDDITISCTGFCDLSGYSGTRTIIADIDYSNHQLRRKYVTETWQNGLLKDSELGSWEVYHTAVEETV